MGHAAKHLAGIEEELDDWFRTLIHRAKELTRRYLRHIEQEVGGQRKEMGYRPLQLHVRVKGNSLELVWQVGRKYLLAGEKAKNGYRWEKVPRKPTRDGGGYRLAELVKRARKGDVELVAELEKEAQVIRREHADAILLRRALTTIRARSRRSAEKREGAPPTAAGALARKPASRRTRTTR